MDYQKGSLKTDTQSKQAAKIEELRAVCRPVVEYLQKNYTPFDKIIVDWSSAELLSGELGASYEVPD